jgi:hypothetical protein
MGTDLKQYLRALNLDDSLFNLKADEYIDALNVSKDAVDPSFDNALTNVTGNRLVPYNKPAGSNVVIGAKADLTRNRVYEFIWNSVGKHSIVIFDRPTRTRTKLIENLTDTNQIDVLGFRRNKKIIHADIIYRDQSEGDLLFWTDGSVSPRKANVKHLKDGIYSYVKTPFIETAKQPPRVPVIAVYGSDPLRNANSLRKKLAMTTYRYVYDDFEKSTFTTYSKIPLPSGYYGSDNDTNDTKNNFIKLTVETGDENVTAIEVAIRFNVAGNWQDFVLVATLNKAQLGIPSNTTYDYFFYNDAIYPPIAVDEVIQLFDWVPRLAKSQCSANGNTIEYGAITENYNNYPLNQLDVTITTENLSNSPPDTDPPQITYTNDGPGTEINYTFTVIGSVPIGSEYEIIVYDPTQPDPYILVFYTSIPGDTIDSIVTKLFNLFPVFNRTIITSPSFIVTFPSGSSVLACSVIAGSGSPSVISTEKTWLWGSNYLFGLIYKDDQGRIMPGVLTFNLPISSDNDFMITTGEFSLDTINPQTPVVNAQINHLPPTGAVSYAWVRRRMTYANFLFYETCDMQSDADFYYFCLANIEQYKIDNSQFVYGTAPITNDSRIKVIAGITGSSYNGQLWNQDYEILGQVTRTLTGGAAPADNRFYIKVKKTTAAVSPAYTENMLVMVYTPMQNPTNAADSVYFEWGEEFPIYELLTMTYSILSSVIVSGETVIGSISGATATVVFNDTTSKLYLDNRLRTFVAGETITGQTSGGKVHLISFTTVNYHRGGTQDQNATQPAKFFWPEGDVYFHKRSMYRQIRAGLPFTADKVSIMDAGFSDFFPSGVNDNGRGITIEANARETYFPATIRFSREYQQNTSINQTNRFFFNNFIDLDRSFGDIFKMSLHDRYIRIGQRYKIGAVPIFNQLTKDSANTSLLAATDALLNPVQYYSGDFGVGREFPVWVDFNNSSYFFDTNRGIWCRLSLDGIIPISVLYNINSWCTRHGILRTGDFFIYGTFDSKLNNCLFTFEATDTDAAATISFDEETNSYEAFLSFQPEFMASLGDLLITYKNGDTWTHDGDLFNNFYGTQFPSTITPVFNQASQVKKKFLSVAYRSNKVWSSPSKGDVMTSTVNQQTNMQQQSKILESQYELQETILTSAFNYDMNSRSDERMGLWEGDPLGGDYCVVKFVCPAASSRELVHFNLPYINYIPSSKIF